MFKSTYLKLLTKFCYMAANMFESAEFSFHGLYTFLDFTPF